MKDCAVMVKDMLSNEGGLPWLTNEMAQSIINAHPKSAPEFAQLVINVKNLYQERDAMNEHIAAEEANR